eukprot:GFUD01040122.1.p1 GENE.GFUD01040122.1~~GFUD01040122.1.p1  ORF type:complete len:381 (-),score=139.23 GFUD01040122.1:297-1439(-)
MKMVPTLSIILLTVVMVLIETNIVKAKPKAKGYAGPGPWDWQNAPSNYPVFNTYPVSKLDQPEFMKINRNISVMIGETAFLPCRVKNLEKYTVSWMRGDDVTVLSVGHLAFSSDKRIGVVQVPRPRLSASDWNLSIENTSLADDGMYECQVNTDPKINYKIALTVRDPAKSIQRDSPYYDVVDPVPASGFEQTHSVIKKHHDKKIDKEGFSMFLHANGCICPKPQFTSQKLGEPDSQPAIEMTIPGGSIQFVTSGGGIMLECLVSGLSSPPLSLYWEKGNKVVTAKERPGVSLETEKVAGVSRISLYIGSVELSDTGNYTCVSDTAKRETVLLVVTQGEEGKVAGLTGARQSSGGETVMDSQTVSVLTISVMATIMTVLG